VQGTYAELALPNNVECGNSHSLSFDGRDGSAGVTQHGSTLDLGGLAGVLHADGSATFGPVPQVAIYSDGSGKTTPGREWLEGWFTPATGPVTGFDGTYLFIADDDGCEVASPTRWSR